MKNIKEKIDRIIKDIKDVNITDKQKLALIYQDLEDLASAKSSKKNETAALKFIAGTPGQIEKIIFDDVKDAENCIKNVSHALNALKMVFESGKKAVESDFLLDSKKNAPEGISGEGNADNANSGNANSGNANSDNAGNDNACADDCLFDIALLDDPETGEPFEYKPFSVIKGLMVKLKEDDELIKEFISSANEHLSEAEQNLLILEQDPLDKDALGSLFRNFHSLKGMASFLQLNDITGLSHEAESLFQGAREGDYNLHGHGVELSFITVDKLIHLISVFQAAYKSNIDPPVNNRVLNIMAALRFARVNNGEISEANINSLKKFLGKEESFNSADENITYDSPFISDSQDSNFSEANEFDTPAANLDMPKEPVLSGFQGNDVRSTEEKLENALKTGAADTVKVDATKLDSLIDTIGELVIVEAMVTHSQQLQDNCSDEDLKNLTQMSKICRELQELSMSMRMVPLKSLFQKMTRVARDASKKLNKKIKLTISGENTELDRVLMEKLADPLVHMIRNAVDHGIESSAKTRLAAGKSETGNIFLKAYYKGGSIIIELQDDGKGLDKDMIIQKAVEQGMYVNPEGMSDEEIYELIFAPGFSTAQSVSNMSGRGVGMDVVRRNISELRGRIEVISNLGQGTTFRMILPLTLAIIDGMVNKIGNGDFIIPTLSILETLNPAEVEMIKSGGAGSGRVFKLRNRLIPMMNIKQFYGIYDEYEGIRQPSIIVLQDMNRVAAIEVDQLVGQQQIVIKSLGKALGTVEGFSGAAIMSDGTVGMIIDVPTILRGVHSKIETLIKS